MLRIIIIEADLKNIDSYKKKSVYKIFKLGRQFKVLNPQNKLWPVFPSMQCTDLATEKIASSVEFLINIPH